MTQHELETALDAGKIYCHVGTRRPWMVRRNGMTQLWKTRPGEFRIPVKIGFRSYGQLTHDNLSVLAPFEIRED